MNLNTWKGKTFRFLTAQTISLFGSSLVQYAIVWYITLTTSSGKMLTISTLCGFLPQILISLFAGVWIDRYDRKRLIMLSDGVIAFSTLLLALAFCQAIKYLVSVCRAHHSFSRNWNPDPCSKCYFSPACSQRTSHENEWAEQYPLLLHDVLISCCRRGHSLRGTFGSSVFLLTWSRLS